MDILSHKEKKNLLIKMFIVQVLFIAFIVVNATQTHREIIIKPFKAVKKPKITLTV